MATRGEPRVTRLIASFLRIHADMTQEEFGLACRVAQSKISDYELGNAAVPEAVLRRMAAAAGLEWMVVVHLRRFFTALLTVTDGKTALPDDVPLPPALEEAVLAVTPYLLEEWKVEPPRPSPAGERREAEMIWDALERFPIPRRRYLIEQTLKASRSWALAERISQASQRAAAHSGADALALAELALSIAKRVEDKPLRWRVSGYCWAYVGNARLMGGDTAGARQAFARAWELWKAGAAAGPELLPERHLVEFAGSLRQAVGSL